jgi:TIR domain
VLWLRVFRMVQGGNEIKREYEDMFRRVKEHLGWLAPSAIQLTTELRQLAGTEIQQRKLQFIQKKAAVASLGIPMRQASRDANIVPVQGPEFAVEKGSRKRGAEEWDVFISHASEDKEAIAKDLAETLRSKGFKVWYDGFSLTLGDSLRESIDRGLARSRYGVVILSKAFFEKHWPTKELNGLATREVNGKKVVLPVWHGVTFEQVCNYSPTLADKLAISTDRGLTHLVDEIVKVLRR